MDWNKENFENDIFLQMAATAKDCIKKTTSDGHTDILKALASLNLFAINSQIVISLFRQLGYFATEKQYEQVRIVFVSRQKIPDSIQHKQRKLYQIQRGLLLQADEDARIRLDFIRAKIEKLETQMSQLPAFFYIWTTEKQ